MICLDNSYWMESTKSPMFKEQADAIKFYCNIKLKSHSLVGVCAMADAALGFLIYPTNDIDKIMLTVNGIRIGGKLRFLEAAANAHSGLVGELYTPMKKRIVFFAGSSLYCPKDDAWMLGETLKDINVASDVITFGNPYYKKRKVFDCFIQSANNKGNDCSICHVLPESSISEALSRSQVIIPRVEGGSSSKPPSSISGAIDIYVKAPSEPTDVNTDCPFCQRVLLTLEEKKVPYNTTFISLDNKPEWFDGTMTLPLISFDDGNWAYDSDVIVEMIEKKHPEPPLVPPPHLAYLGLKILPKLAGFLKSKDDTDENDASKQALLDELKRLEVHLSKYSLKNLESFENTKPSPENVNEGWRQRLTCK
ncbi:dehydroascorbate reductase 2 [Tanacetum coccineum]